MENGHPGQLGQVAVKSVEVESKPAQGLAPIHHLQMVVNIALVAMMISDPAIINLVYMVRYQIKEKVLRLKIKKH
jgi:hypothetical protein